MHRLMNKNSLNSKLNIPHMIVASLITACLYIIMIAICRITPFGDRTWLMYNMKLQYVDYYAYAKQLINGESNIFYSFSTTLGAGTIGLFTYFLTSPFVYLSALFPNSMMPLAITVIIGIELSLSSLTMDIFLQKYCGKSAYLCAVSYGFCGYIIANAMNIMWLDVIVMLPIVMLTTERLIRDGKLIGYIVSVAIILLLNYYISYMVLIFIVLWTFVRLFALREKGAALIISRLGMATVAAAGSVSVVLIPTFLELRNNQITAKVDEVAETVSNTTLKQIAAKVFSLTSDSMEMYWGAPMLFCGLVVLVLSILYIVDGKISWRERLAMIVLGTILIASFASEDLNLFWHVGVQHADFPYREAIFLSFILITCACSELNSLRKGIAIKGIFAIILLVSSLAIYALRNPATRIAEWKISYNYYIIYLVIILIIGLGHAQNKNVRRLFAVLIIMCQFVDIGLNGVYIYKSEAINAERTSAFESVVMATEPTVQAVKNADHSFYRMDNWSPRGQNDGMLFGYNSVTNYSISSLNYSKDFLQRLGFDDDETYLDYGHDNTETADSLLGIKYVLTDASHGFRMHKDYELAFDGDVQAYRNPYALPLAVGVYREMSGESSDPFSLQEEIYTRLTGQMTDIFIDANVETNTTQYYGSRPRVDYAVTALKSGELYFYMADLIDNFDNMEVYINEEFVTYYGNDACLKVLNLGYMDAGETMYVTIVADDEEEFGSAIFVTEDTDALADAYNKVSSRFASINKLSSSHLSLSLDSSYTVGDDISGQVGIYTSIPYEKGWHVKVAGAKVKPVEVYDSLMYIPVTEAIQQRELGPGENLIVDLVYIPEGFFFGAGTSLVTLIMMILVAMLRKSEAGYFEYEDDEEDNNEDNMSNLDR